MTIIMRSILPSKKYVSLFAFISFLCIILQLIFSVLCYDIFFFFSSRRRHTRYWRDWSSDVCSSDLIGPYAAAHVMMMLGRYSRLILDSWTRPTYARLVGKPSVADEEIEERFSPYGPDRKSVV